MECLSQEVWTITMLLCSLWGFICGWVLKKVFYESKNPTGAIFDEFERQKKVFARMGYNLKMEKSKKRE